MALSADKIRDSKGTPFEDTVAIATGQTVHVGSLAAFTTAGRVRAAAAAANLRPAGVVEAIVNDSGTAIGAATGNTAGSVKARIAWGHQVLVAVRTAARTFANIGKNVFVADDDAVTDATGAGTAGVRVKIGSIASMSSDKATAWVALRVYGDADAS